jgi:hypothetical protein
MANWVTISENRLMGLVSQLATDLQATKASKDSSQWRAAAATYNSAANVAVLFPNCACSREGRLRELETAILAAINNLATLSSAAKPAVASSGFVSGLAKKEVKRIEGDILAARWTIAANAPGIAGAIQADWIAANQKLNKLQRKLVAAKATAGIP